LIHDGIMIELKSVSLRLYLDAAQAVLCRKTGGCVRLVKNLGLEQRSTFSRPGRSINYYAQRAELSALKEAAPFLREAPHHCLQEALVDLDKAFANFFAGRAAYPKRQKKRDGCSFRFPDPKQFHIRGDTSTPDRKRNRGIRDVVLHLPKLGDVRASMPRALPPGARIKSVTVSSSGDWWCASILYERKVDLPEDRSQQAVVGVDLGVCQPVATSIGEILTLPRVTERGKERERRLNRTVSRRKKGSSNRRKAVRALVRFKAAQARRRRDAREKLTTRLAKNHGVIAMEGLKLRNMTASAQGTAAEPGRNVAQKAGLNRSLLDMGMGTMRLRLGQKLAADGGVLLLVPPAHTSQRCNACGHIDPDNRPERDTFRCVACGHEADPDVNAALNIRDYALGLWGDAGRVKVVASLPLLLEQQAKAKSRFRNKTTEGTGGHPGPACGDHCEGMSVKQEMTRRKPGKMAA
jgi:putative transposase